MEYVIIGIAAFFLVIIVMIRDEFKRKRDNLKKIKEAWGKSPKREYSYEEFESISHYAKKMKSDFRIDDITWNDLGMDPVFMLLNNTHSSVGEEYLYHVLRTPVFDENILNEREPCLLSII